MACAQHTPSPSSSSSSSHFIKRFAFRFATMTTPRLSSIVHAACSPDSREGLPKEDPHALRITVVEPHQPPPTEAAAAAADDDDDAVNYMARAQWLRAAVLGANDGLVSVASLMVGVGAVNETAKAMVVSGLAGLVAGACSMAIGEYVSVYAQYDIQVSEMERRGRISEAEKKEDEEELPSPMMAAGASALAFAIGGLLPLLGGAFLKSWGARVGVVCAVSSLGLAGFGALGAVLGGAKVAKSALRVLVGGWLAMLVTYGVLRAFGVIFKMQVSSA